MARKKAAAVSGTTGHMVIQEWDGLPEDLKEGEMRYGVLLDIHNDAQPEQISLAIMCAVDELLELNPEAKSTCVTSQVLAKDLISREGISPVPHLVQGGVVDLEKTRITGKYGYKLILSSPRYDERPMLDLLITDLADKGSSKRKSLVDWIQQFNGTGDQDCQFAKVRGVSPGGVAPLRESISKMLERLSVVYGPPTVVPVSETMGGAMNRWVMEIENDFL